MVARNRQAIRPVRRSAAPLWYGHDVEDASGLRSVASAAAIGRKPSVCAPCIASPSWTKGVLHRGARWHWIVGEACSLPAVLLGSSPRSASLTLVDSLARQGIAWQTFPIGVEEARAFAVRYDGPNKQV